MAQLRETWDKRRPSIRVVVSLSLGAGVTLCLLVFLIVALRPGEGADSSSAASLTPGTTGYVSTTMSEQIQPAENITLVTPDTNTAIAASSAVTVAGTPDAVPPTDSTTPMPTAAPQPTVVKSPAPANPVAAAVTHSSATATTQTPITRVRIPSIGVNAPVEVKGLDGDGAMQAPDSPSVVAWYDFSAQPGSDGNTVFAGHLDYAGVGPAVFWRLDQVQSGAEIDVLDEDGQSFRYRVTSVRSYSANADASPIVASTGNPTITLITCDGTFDRSTGEYNQRVVVTGTLIN